MPISILPGDCLLALTGRRSHDNKENDMHELIPLPEVLRWGALALVALGLLVALLAPREALGGWGLSALAVWGLLSLRPGDLPEPAPPAVPVWAVAAAAALLLGGGVSAWWAWQRREAAGARRRQQARLRATLTRLAARQGGRLTVATARAALGADPQALQAALAALYLDGAADIAMEETADGAAVAYLFPPPADGRAS